jgi:hypothetical protein
VPLSGEADEAETRNVAVVLELAQSLHYTGFMELRLVLTPGRWYAQGNVSSRGLRCEPVVWSPSVRL